MYKLIAIDLDGTLLDDEKNISREDSDLIEQLTRNGYEVVIATGRGYWSAKQLTKDISKSFVILANNGNVVRETGNGKTFITKYLDMDDFRLLIGEANKGGFHSIVHMDNYSRGYDIIVEKEIDAGDIYYHNYLSRFQERYKKIDDHMELKDSRILAVVYVGTKKDMEYFHGLINQRYPGRYNSHIVENIQSAEALLEVMNPLGCKWISLLEYAEGKGIDRSEIIAIGDDNNDIQMIENAGCGIAMKNAGARVKQVADIITERDNNQSGVAFELKKLLNI
ncbi:MAG: Cof-type HAD-IIB family hydrolase [Tissierellia bacterium]|nr:Cof-type HAD-IIB family hydrolase [Tissierellia bacterium]